jgi:hypothetical protein
MADYSVNQARPISTLTYDPIQITNAQYTNFNPPAANTGHWQAYRVNHNVNLKFLGSEPAGRNIQVTVKIGGVPVVCDAHIV